MFVKASEIKEEAPRLYTNENPTLTQEEIKELEKNFNYSCIMFESDILRFRFDITQFKPNVAYEIKFLDLIPLYNEHYFKYDRVFLNLFKKTFVVIKSQGYEDTFLLFLTDKKNNYEALKKLSNMRSNRYKANFTRKERQLLYRLKNGQTVENIKYGMYYENLLDEMQELEEHIKEKEEIKRVYSKMYDNLRKTKDERRETLRGVLEILYNDINEAEEKLLNLKIKEDNFIYSIDEKETEIEDYYMED